MMNWREPDADSPPGGSLEAPLGKAGNGDRVGPARATLRGRLAGELESIIWTVNPQNNSLDRFARFVQQFAPRFFRDTAIACTVAWASRRSRRFRSTQRSSIIS